METQNQTTQQHQEPQFTSEDLARQLLGEDEPTFENEDVNEDHTPNGEATEPVISADIQTRYDAYKDIGVEFPEEFKLEDIESVENLQAKVKEYSAQKQTNDDDPFISSYRKAKEEGISHEEFMEREVERKRFLSLGSDDGLKRIYSSITNDKGEPRYSEEAIDEHLNKMTQIQKDQEWQGIKNKYKEQEPTKPQETKEQNTDFNSQISDFNDKQVPKLAEDISKEFKDNIAGIPFGETDKKEFNNTFQDMLKVDAKSEVKQFMNSKALEIFQDPKELYQVLYIHSKIKNGGFNNLIKDMKDSEVEKALNAAGISPQQRGGQTSDPVLPPNPDDFV